MEINLIRLKSKKFSSLDLSIDNNFIEEINDALFDNDVVLKENAANPLLNVLFVESDDIDKEFKAVRSELSEPVIILVGKHYSALKSALEINSTLALLGVDPLVINGREAPLLNELSKVAMMKKRIEKSSLGLVGIDHSLLERNDIATMETKYHIGVYKITKREFQHFYDNLETTKLVNNPYINAHYSEKDIIEISRLYYTALAIIDNFHLQGIAFGLKEYGTLLEPVCALLNERGISAINEFDLMSLLSLYTLSAATDTQSIYAQIIKIDFEKSHITLQSRVAPINLLRNVSSIVKGEVTLYKLSYDKKHILVSEANILSSANFNNGISIELEISDHRIFNIINEAIGGTLALSYGDSVGSLLAYDNILRIENEK